MHFVAAYHVHLQKHEYELEYTSYYKRCANSIPFELGVNGHQGDKSPMTWHAPPEALSFAMKSFRTGFSFMEPSPSMALKVISIFRKCHTDRKYSYVPLLSSLHLSFGTALHGNHLYQLNYDDMCLRKRSINGGICNDNSNVSEDCVPQPSRNILLLVLMVQVT